MTAKRRNLFIITAMYTLVLSTVTFAQLKSAHAQDDTSLQETESAVEAEPAPTPEPVAEPAPADVEEEEAKSYGINIDMGFATIYNFRGFNSFQESTQQDANAAFFPSITSRLRQFRCQFLIKTKGYKKGGALHVTAIDII